jgi:dihydrofolate reductase
MNWVIETVRGAGGYLLGRGTYEIFAAHWPNASEEEQMLAEPLNMRPKYVTSTTLVEPLEWQYSTLLRGDVGDAVRALKAQDGDDLLVIGSPGLVQSLVQHDLLDEEALAATHDERIDHYPDLMSRPIKGSSDLWFRGLPRFLPTNAAPAYARPDRDERGPYEEYPGHLRPPATGVLPPILTRPVSTG